MHGEKQRYACSFTVTPDLNTIERRQVLHSIVESAHKRRNSAKVAARIGGESPWLPGTGHAQPPSGFIMIRLHRVLSGSQLNLKAHAADAVMHCSLAGCPPSNSPTLAPTHPSSGIHERTHPLLHPSTYSHTPTHTQRPPSYTHTATAATVTARGDRADCRGYHTQRQSRYPSCQQTDNPAAPQSSQATDSSF
jgi:hypothetical protein